MQRPFLSEQRLLPAPRSISQLADAFTRFDDFIWAHNELSETAELVETRQMSKALGQVERASSSVYEALSKCCRQIE